MSRASPTTPWPAAAPMPPPPIYLPRTSASSSLPPYYRTPSPPPKPSPTPPLRRRRIATLVLTLVLLITLVAIYLGLTLTPRHSLQQEWHVLLVLSVLASTLVFVYALVRIWVDLVKTIPQQKCVERDGRPPSYCSRARHGEMVVMENRWGGTQ